jgi:hypothetical protein
MLEGAEAVLDRVRIRNEIDHLFELVPDACVNLLRRQYSADDLLRGLLASRTGDEEAGNTRSTSGHPD